MFNLAGYTWENIPAPGMYGVYHICCLVICIALCVLFALKGLKPHDKKQDDKTILIIDLILIVTEIIKQLMYHVQYYHYLRIDVLPFSFCSVPIYLALIGALSKKEKLHELCYKFLAFFGTVGGLAVMLYPTTLETNFIYISFQTMLWHTLLAVMGIYLIAARGYGRNLKREVMPAFALLAALSLVAIGLNELSYNCYLKPLQTPVISVDDVPGSYEYYKLGFVSSDSGEYSFLSLPEDGSIGLTTDPLSAANVYITYPEGDNYELYYLNVETDAGETKYLDIQLSSGTPQLLLLDAPGTNWIFEYLGDRIVFSKNLDGTVFCPSPFSSCLTVQPTASSPVYPDFVKVKTEHESDSANFFFISRYCDTPIPVLGLVQDHAPYPIFVLAYLVSFFGMACLVFAGAKGLRKAVTVRTGHKK